MKQVDRTKFLTAGDSRPLRQVSHTVAAASGRTPPDYIHLGVSKEIVPTLREAGVDPDPVIRAAGLHPRVLDGTMNVIPFASLSRLYTLCVARTGCPHFGLLVGRRASILSLGLVGRLMQHSNTVGDAVRVLVLNRGVEDRAVVPSLTTSDGTVLLRYTTYQADSSSGEQILDAAMGITVNILRTLRGSDWRPDGVLLPRAAPADQAQYRHHFRAPVRFNQESATIVFPTRDLDLQIAGADALLRAMLEDKIQQSKSAEGREFSDDVRRLMRTRLTSDRFSAEDTAELLEMHRRTLSRYLKSDGAGYRAMTNEIRFEIARQLMQDTQVSFAQIAAALGYSEASAFTRAFRRWSGQTPTAWRTEVHHQLRPGALNIK